MIEKHVRCEAAAFVTETAAFDGDSAVIDAGTDECASRMAESDGIEGERGRETTNTPTLARRKPRKRMGHPHWFVHEHGSSSRT
jgi:hypothetical protein